MINPEYFDWGRRVQEGMQQSQDNRRKNALLDLERRQFGLNERRVSAEEARLAQAEAERLAELKRAEAENRKPALYMRYAAGDKSVLPQIAEAEGLGPEDLQGVNPDQFVDAMMRVNGWTAEQPKPPASYQEFELGQQNPAYAAYLAQQRERAPKDAPAPSYRDIIDPADPSRLITVDGRLYRGGSLGSPGVLGIAGKEPAAAKADETRGTGRQAVSEQISNLRYLYEQLQKGGGIVDPASAGPANIVNRIQSSDVGQYVGGALGTENQSIRNQIKQARPLLLQAIRQATGMTARQMDSNVELKLYLSAATDPQLDVKANFAALENLERLIGESSAINKAPAGQPQDDPLGLRQ